MSIAWNNGIYCLYVLFMAIHCPNQCQTILGSYDGDVSRMVSGRGYITGYHHISVAAVWSLEHYDIITL